MMRRRKPFKQVDANRRNRTQDLLHNDPSVLEKPSYSPTSSIVAKTRHLVNDEGFDFLSSSLELKIARKHEEHQKKARAEIATARERSMKEKSQTIERTIESKSSRFGSQTKTPKISNCTGNESNITVTRPGEAGSQKTSNDEKPESDALSGAQTEGCNRKTKRNTAPLNKPKLETIEEEDPMQLSDLVADRYTISQEMNDSNRFNERTIHGPSVDKENKERHREDLRDKSPIEGLDRSQNDRPIAFDNNNIDVANPCDRNTTPNSHVSAVLASHQRFETEIDGLSSHLGQDHDTKNDWFEDMEIVGTDDDSLRSSSASSHEKSTTFDSNQVQSPAPSAFKKTSSHEAADAIPSNRESEMASKFYQSPLSVQSTPKRFLESASVSRDLMRSNLTSRFQRSPIMPNSASLSRTPISLKNVTRRKPIPSASEKQRQRNGETLTSVGKLEFGGDDPNSRQDAHDQEDRLRKQTFHSTDCSPELTVDEILRALIASPPENEAVVRAMLTSCGEERFSSDGLLSPGYVVNVAHGKSDVSCGETSEVTCDIDRGYAFHKRKKKQNVSEPSKRSKKSTKTTKKEEQSDSESLPLLTKISREKTPEKFSREDLSEKGVVVDAQSNLEYFKRNLNPLAETTPGTSEIGRTFRVLTPPTNPCLSRPTPMSVEKAGARGLSYESNMNIYSPYLWTAEKAGHFIIEPIFQHVDGKFYRHPPLPPGWTMSLSASRGLPFYHHPDFGSTWYAPVALPMIKGNFASRRMLVSTNANGNMIPWSGYVDQFIKTSMHRSSPCEEYTSGSVFFSASGREKMSSRLLPSVPRRETPMLPMVSRNVAFSDLSNLNAQEDKSMTQKNELHTAPLAGKKISQEQNQESQSSESHEDVPLSNHCNADLESNSHGEDSLDATEIVSKFAGKSSAGKVDLIQSKHWSPELSAPLSSTGQCDEFTTSNGSVSSSESHDRGILDTPARSSSSSEGSRSMIGSAEGKLNSPQRKHDLYFDDFRGVGFNSEDLSRNQAHLSNKALENTTISGVVDLGRTHVCMSQQKNYGIGCSETSRKVVTKTSDEESGPLDPIGFESPNSSQSDDIGYSAPDEGEDQMSHVSNSEGPPSSNSSEPHRGIRETIDTHINGVYKLDHDTDARAEDSDSSEQPLTTEAYESPNDRESRHPKASSVFIPRLNRTSDEMSLQLPRDADNASVHSWLSRASSLMSACSHRVRFPPMPICSLQALDACPVVSTKATRIGRFQKKKIGTKTKKVRDKSKKNQASKTTRRNERS